MTIRRKDRNGIYCDEPMARKKKMLKYCKHECENCYCAIVTSPSGEKEHVDLLSERYK